MKESTDALRRIFNHTRDLQKKHWHGGSYSSGWQWAKPLFEKHGIPPLWGQPLREEGKDEWLPQIGLWPGLINFRETCELPQDIDLSAVGHWHAKGIVIPVGNGLQLLTDKKKDTTLSAGHRLFPPAEENLMPEGDEILFVEQPLYAAKLTGQDFPAIAADTTNSFEKALTYKKVTVLFCHNKKMSELWAKAIMHALIKIEHPDIRKITCKDSDRENYPLISEIYDNSYRLISTDMTDAGNVERFVSQHGENVRYNIERKAWRHWNGSKWEEAQQETIDALGRDTLDALREEPGAADWYTKCRGTVRLGALTDRALKAVRQLHIKTACENPDIYRINLLNCSYDLEKHEMSPHNRKHLMTKIANTTYDRDADCPLWKRFIKQIMSSDPGKARLLQQSYGLALTGDVSEQKFFILWGDGANGKSVAIGVPLFILGEYARTMESELLIRTPSHHNSSGELADLYGVRFAAASETHSGARLDEAQIKNMTGGDTIKARRLYEAPFEYSPEFTPFMTTNHKPSFGGSDYGMVRRLALISFNRRFEGDEIDKKITQKLCSEGPGILNWMIDGFKDVQENGLIIPTIVKEETEEYAREESPIRQDLEISVAFEKGSTVTIDERYQQYIIACKNGGVRNPIGKNNYNKEVRKCGWQSKHTKTGMVWMNMGTKKFHSLNLPE